MKIPTLALAILSGSIALVCLSCTITAPADGAAQFAEALPIMAGKSPRDLNEDHAGLLAGIREENQESFPQFVPWHVWHYTNDAGEDRYVLFSVQEGQGIPGASRAGIRLFSATGGELGAWNFPTGWRIGVRSAGFARHDLLDAPLITIHTAPVILGRDVARQHFAIEDDTLFFVRMESSKGELLRNRYVFPNHTLGVDVSDQSKKQWISNLTSDSAVRRLASLVYIAGEHMDPDRPRKDVRSQSVDEAQKAREVRNDEAVARAIEIYRESTWDWLKGAAELAGNPEI